MQKDAVQKAANNNATDVCLMVGIGCLHVLEAVRIA